MGSLLPFAILVLIATMFLIKDLIEEVYMQMLLGSCWQWEKENHISSNKLIYIHLRKQFINDLLNWDIFLVFVGYTPIKGGGHTLF